MDYTQALEILHNVQSILHEKGEITVTPKAYRQIEAAIHEVEEKISLQEGQNNELATEIAELRSSRDKLKEDLREINENYIVAIKEKKVKKKK